MSAAHVNGTNFEEEVVKSQLPVLVDFGAEWCGPCKMIGPIVDEVADELSGKMKVVKVDIDESQELAMKFGIMSIPTLLIFKGGSIVEQLVGAMAKDQLLEKITTHVR